MIPSSSSCLRTRLAGLQNDIKDLECQSKEFDLKTRRLADFSRFVASLCANEPQEEYYSSAGVPEINQSTSSDLRQCRYTLDPILLPCSSVGFRRQAPYLRCKLWLSKYDPELVQLKLCLVVRSLTPGFCGMKSSWAESHILPVSTNPNPDPWIVDVPLNPRLYGFPVKARVFLFVALLGEDLVVDVPVSAKHDDSEAVFDILHFATNCIQITLASGDSLFKSQTELEFEVCRILNVELTDPKYSECQTEGDITVLFSPSLQASVPDTKAWLKEETAGLRSPENMFITASEFLSILLTSDSDNGLKKSFFCYTPMAGNFTADGKRETNPNQHIFHSLAAASHAEFFKSNGTSTLVEIEIKLLKSDSGTRKSTPLGSRVSKVQLNSRCVPSATNSSDCDTGTQQRGVISIRCQHPSVYHAVHAAIIRRLSDIFQARIENCLLPEADVGAVGGAVGAVDLKIEDGIPNFCNKDGSMLLDGDGQANSRENNINDVESQAQKLKNSNSDHDLWIEFLEYECENSKAARFNGEDKETVQARIQSETPGRLLRSFVEVEDELKASLLPIIVPLAIKME